MILTYFRILFEKYFLIYISQNKKNNEQINFGIKCKT